VGGRYRQEEVRPLAEGSGPARLGERGLAAGQEAVAEDLPAQAVGGQERGNVFGDRGEQGGE